MDELKSDRSIDLTEKQTDKRTNERTNRRTNEQTNERINVTENPLNKRQMKDKENPTFKTVFVFGQRRILMQKGKKRKRGNVRRVDLRT